ncbi:MAG: sigma-70 family RNA polymerase sigma factor [Planctomycetaceae bacterium]
MPQTRPSLLLRLRSQQDSSSWKEFTATYSQVINHYAKPYGRCVDDQLDIAQNVWVILCRIMPSFQYQPGRGGFRSLLRRIVKTSAIDWIRRRSQLQLCNDTVAQATSRCEIDIGLDDQKYVLIRSLEMVRGKSSPVAWSCFERHVLDRQSAREVALQLGLSDNAVYVNSSRVLDRVRSCCNQITRAQHHD